MEIKFENEIIEQYIKPKGMLTKKSERFANQLHIAIYGETLEEKIIIEKKAIVQNLLWLGKLSVRQIAEVVNENIDFVTKVKKSLKKINTVYRYILIIRVL